MKHLKKINIIFTALNIAVIAFMIFHVTLGCCTKQISFPWWVGFAFAFNYIPLLVIINVIWQIIFKVISGGVDSSPEVKRLDRAFIIADIAMTAVGAAASYLIWKFVIEFSSVPTDGMLLLNVPLAITNTAWFIARKYRKTAELLSDPINS